MLLDVHVSLRRCAQTRSFLFSGMAGSGAAQFAFMFLFCAGVGLVSYQIFMFYPHFAFFHLKLEKLLRMYKLKKKFSYGKSG